MVDKKYYVENEELKKHGISIIYTKKSYGNVMKMEKEKFVLDFDFQDKVIIGCHQTHSDNIAVIEDLEKTYFENTDGLISSRKDVVLYTKYGDCLPIYFYDKKKKIIGVVHSGWIGSYKEIGIKALEIFKRDYKSELEDIIVILGISISEENYEVQQDFLDKFMDKFDGEIIEKSFKIRDRKIFFDNKKFNIENFIKFGIAKENILTNEYCTFRDDFHSYRREKEKSGRNGSFISFIK